MSKTLVSLVVVKRPPKGHHPLGVWFRSLKPTEDAPKLAFHAKDSTTAGLRKSPQYPGPKDRHPTKVQASPSGKDEAVNTLRLPSASCGNCATVKCAGVWHEILHSNGPSSEITDTTTYNLQAREFLLMDRQCHPQQSRIPTETGLEQLESILIGQCCKEMTTC